MAQKILSKNQEKFLELFQKTPLLSSNFVLSGGTALAAFYLHHRYSEDLDFFSREEFNPTDIFPLLQPLLKPLGYKKIEYQQSFNRNLYFFVKKGDVLKTEFTYFPFEPIEKPLLHKGVLIDSLKDIAVNKAFIIYQKPRLRDFIDLYVTIKKTGWELNSLLKLARVKFDTHIDYLQMGAQLLKVSILKDSPYLIGKIKINPIKSFFLKAAGGFKKKILG